MALCSTLIMTLCTAPRALCCAAWLALLLRVAVTLWVVGLVAAAAPDATPTIRPVKSFTGTASLLDTDPPCDLKFTAASLDAPHAAVVRNTGQVNVFNWAEAKPPIGDGDSRPGLEQNSLDYVFSGSGTPEDASWIGDLQVSHLNLVSF